ncbi:MAG TPA: AzlD domain-containing protein [Beijerinckiaceae bacterium]
MTIEALLAGPAAPYVAIAAMALATYLCRASGVVLMSRVHLTPRVTRALAALPGSIVVATVMPLAWQAGLPAMAGVAAALVTMTALRYELAALMAGLGTVAALRALGL